MDQDFGTALGVLNFMVEIDCMGESRPTNLKSSITLLTSAIKEWGAADAEA